MTFISTTKDGDRRRQSGQIIVVLAVILTILTFVVLWNFDLHKILHTKKVTQNAGDSAALVAARWQGISLNLMGDLNLLHAIALTTSNYPAESAITNIQARLCFTGPMIAFMASQQAAMNNGVPAYEEFNQDLIDRINEVRNVYTFRAFPGGPMACPEPYPDCWNEYARMLETVLATGIAAECANPEFYMDVTGGHVLLETDFYRAVAGQQWCWFFLRGDNLLANYQNFFPCWWPDIPAPPHIEPVNSAIYGLGLAKQVTTMNSYLSTSEANDAASARGMVTPISSTGMAVEAAWYCYNANKWGSWDAIKTTSSNNFPATGTLKPQYDYAGADAAVAICKNVTRTTPGPHNTTSSDDISWSAAAKPFGYLNESDNPTIATLVLPAFREVRMIPVDTSSAPSSGSFDLDWRKHIELHLPDYMSGGPNVIRSSCWYCQQLITWEDNLFRQTGIDWLEEYSYLCTLPSYGGGGGGGGGSRRGH